MQERTKHWTSTELFFLFFYFVKSRHSLPMLKYIRFLNLFIPKRSTILSQNLIYNSRFHQNWDQMKRPHKPTTSIMGSLQRKACVNFKNYAIFRLFGTVLGRLNSKTFIPSSGCAVLV